MVLYAKMFLIGLFLLKSLNVHSQKRIFVTISGGDLYSIDLINCDKSFIGSTGKSFGDIAFTSNGSLWGVIGDELYKIDTSDASTTLIGITGIWPVSLIGLNDTILLAEFQKDLYKINTNDASVNLIGEIGYQASGDLVLLNNVLYMITPLVKIELDKTFSEILSVSPVDLMMPGCEGAATLNDHYSSIIGFSAIGPIKICPIDGSYTTICPDLYLEGIPGAASLPDDPDRDELVNVFTPNGDGINDFFQPVGDLYHINSVTIFNRWGNIITELSYPFIWNGTSQSGTELIEGVYYYTLEKKGECNDQNPKQSTIQLIR